MRRIIETFLILLILTNLFSGCATGPTLVEQNPVDREYSGSIVLRNKTIPLPEGIWKVIGSGKSSSGQLFEMLLIKSTDSNILNDSIIITVDTISTQGRDNGYAKSKAFEKFDYHHIDVTNNNAGEAQEGWLVKHSRMSIKDTRKAFKEAYAYLKDNNYILPTNHILALHRFTGKGIKKKYLVLSYYKNPETDGFGPPNSTDYATSDWSPLHISKYPDKLLYVQEFIRTNEMYHQKLKEGFGG